ncbi:hypothetical protein BKA70DRAFT_87073 [Coprinopsis sp. MPI-PUGE-AT-0042]|nr:hypothetical protein BKA70DRAFT_87073 [Coprinopsis sp. MPI-PUGE-AT-0042]
MIVWRCGLALSRFRLLLSAGVVFHTALIFSVPAEHAPQPPSLSSPRHQHNGGTSTATVERINEDTDNREDRPRSQRLLCPPPAVRGGGEAPLSSPPAEVPSTLPEEALEPVVLQRMEGTKSETLRRPGARGGWGFEQIGVRLVVDAYVVVRSHGECCEWYREWRVAVVVDEKTEYWKQWEKWHQNRQAVPNYPISC